LDVSAVSFWRPQERVFLDVRVFDPNRNSYIKKDPKDIPEAHEKLKKKDYSDRVLQVGRGSLAPPPSFFQRLEERVERPSVSTNILQHSSMTEGERTIG
jgi:hypothetical protein